MRDIDITWNNDNIVRSKKRNYLGFKLGDIFTIINNSDKIFSLWLLILNYSLQVYTDPQLL